jgi:hypothetical protein
LHENNYFFEDDTIDYAIEYADFETIKYLHEIANCKFNDYRTFEEAALRGDLKIMQWLLDKDCYMHYDTMEKALFNGNI